MLCSLPSSGSAYFATSVCAVRNGRRKMEDRHVVIHDLNTLFNIQVSNNAILVSYGSIYWKILGAYFSWHISTCHFIRLSHEGLTSLSEILSKSVLVILKHHLFIQANPKQSKLKSISIDFTDCVISKLNKFDYCIDKWIFIA